MTVAMDARLVSRLARMPLAIAVAALALASAGGRAAPPPLADLQRQFAAPPDDARIMMRWWWFGPAVTRAGLEREMRLMKEGGIGGFEIQPVYPLVLDDPARGLVTHPFLSDAFLDDVRFAAGKARELGLRADLTIGSGWPYGGPQVGITQAAGKLRVERVPVPAGAVRVAVPDVRSRILRAGEGIALRRGEEDVALLVHRIAEGRRRELRGVFVAVHPRRLVRGRPARPDGHDGHRPHDQPAPHPDPRHHATIPRGPTGGEP